MHPRKQGGYPSSFTLPTGKGEPIGARPAVERGSQPPDSSARLDEDVGGEKQGRLAPDGWMDAWSAPRAGL
jgi:hypothetical protein